MNTTETATAHPFLAGGGEMGELTRQYNWSGTDLGTPDQWPLSLRTTLGLILHSAFPMFLFWGPDLLCFYNDAYRVSLGDNGKHPAVGKPAIGVWPEIWDFIGPMINRVMNTGEPTFFKDQLVPIYRNGRLEDVYWTFSYSPAYGDEGQISGVFVTCTETTEQVAGHRALTISQKRFERMMEEAPVAMALFSGTAFVITLANERVLEFWGRNREQVMNKPLFEALPEASGQGFEELLMGVYTTGERFVAKELTVTLERKGRLEQTYIDFVYEPFREIDGTISGITVVCLEITDQVLSRRKVEESEGKLRSVVSAVPAAMVLFVGRELVVDMPSQNFIDIIDRGPHVTGKPLKELMPELESQSFLQILNEVYVTGKAYSVFGTQVDIVQQDGSMTHDFFNLIYTPLFNTQHQVYAILSIATNVTEVVEARQSLQQSEERYRTLSAELEQQVQQRTEELAAANEELAAINEKLATTNEELRISNEETTAANQNLLDSNKSLIRSNENLERFAYVASHDLQEPLRKVQQFGDLIINQYSRELGEGVTYLERMQSAASRMSTLIRDLLTFSRIATQPDEVVRVSLNAVLNSVLTDLDLRIQETAAIITVDSLPVVHGDPSQLGQLFQNLLSNALKFRRLEIIPIIAVTCQLVAHGDLPPLVKPTRPARLYYRIDVADNGIGFDEQYLDRIFQVFQRLGGRTQYAGTGIGLAICEKVAANHGGAITANSQPGEGATFRVYLPQ